MPPCKMLMEDKRLFLVLSPETALVFHKGSEERRATCGPERQRGLTHRLLGLTFGGTHALSQVMPHLSLAVLETGTQRRHPSWGLPEEGASKRIKD